MIHLSFLLVAGYAALASVQSRFSPLRAPAIPLALKSPYMSTWQQAGSDNGNGGYLAGQWPMFWNDQVTGWTGMIRVDNSTYTWMGAPTNNRAYTNLTAFQYTSTKSIFTMNVGPVQMTIAFLSPVTTDDLLQSSMPFTYMNFEARSTDGDGHDIQLYSDISAEWVSGDRGATAQWEYGTIQGNSQPEAYGPASGATSTSQAPTTYGTRTAFTIPPLITAHKPIFAPKGIRPDPASNTPSPNFSALIIQPAAATGGVAYHSVYRQQQLEFAQANEQAEWGYPSTTPRLFP